MCLNLTAECWKKHVRMRRSIWKFSRIVKDAVQMPAESPVKEKTFMKNSMKEKWQKPFHTVDQKMPAGDQL